MSTFALTPEEHATPGINQRGDRLRLRPTAGTIAAACVFLIVECSLIVAGVLKGGVY